MMAKSKQKKQEEAISRKRDHFRTHAYPLWQKQQPGGDWYESELKSYGKNDAAKMASEADIMLTKAAAEAHVDRHGNPII